MPELSLSQNVRFSLCRFLDARFCLAKSQAGPSQAEPRRPKPTQKPTAYRGGKIYYSANQDLMRVLARCGDRHEQRFKINWDDKPDVIDQWPLACAIIETDGRP